MPLLASASDSAESDANLALAPPLDVHWVWHVHMLSPVSYMLDCRCVVGRVLGHRMKSMAELREDRKRTEVLWKEHFKVEFQLQSELAIHQRLRISIKTRNNGMLMVTFFLRSRLAIRNNFVFIPAFALLRVPTAFIYLLKLFF